MNFFLKKLTKRDNKLKRIDSALETSFHGVKKDVSKIFEWLSYLYHRNQFQDRVIHELQTQLHQIPKTQEELKELIDEHYALTPLKDKVKKLSAKVDSLDDTHSTITSLKYKLEDIKAKLDPLDAQSDQINNMVSKISKITRKIEEMEDNNHPLRKHVEEHHSRLERLEELPQKKSITTTRENLIRKIAKSSKDHVKNLIKSLIMKYGQISALQLRDIIVEEQGLCSKSSFYRILEELDEDENISVIHEKKEKRFTFNMNKIS